MLLSCALTFVQITSTAIILQPQDELWTSQPLLEVGLRGAGLHSTGFFVTTLKSLQKNRLRANFRTFCDVRCSLKAAHKGQLQF
jgi:hypothetical protein